MDENPTLLANEDAAIASDLAAVEEARAQIARGEFVTMEAVMAWVDSWETEHELPVPQPAYPLKPYRG